MKNEELINNCKYQYISFREEKICCYAESERAVIMRECKNFKNCYYRQLEKYKQYFLNIGMIIEELEQQYDDIKDFTEIKEIKEILKEVN